MRQVAIIGIGQTIVAEQWEKSLRELAGEAFEGLMGEFVADGPDDDARHTAHDVRLVAEPFDFLQNSFFLFFGKVRSQDNDHNGFRVVAGVVTKKPQVATCGWVANVGLTQSREQVPRVEKIKVPPGKTEAESPAA